jgi:hypothetical protein
VRYVCGATCPNAASNTSSLSGTVATVISRGTLR